MIIRKMREEDLLEVCSIEENTFSTPWKYHDFLSSMQNENNIYLVVDSETKILAYCGLWGVAGEGQINNVAVRKEFRNQKIAFFMLEELIKRGRQKELNAFTLEVRESNLNAIRLYHKLGFKNAGIRRNFYDKPKEDAIIMWL